MFDNINQIILGAYVAAVVVNFLLVGFSILNGKRPNKENGHSIVESGAIDRSELDKQKLITQQSETVKDIMNAQSNILVNQHDVGNHANAEKKSISELQTNVHKLNMFFSNELKQEWDKLHRELEEYKVQRIKIIEENLQILTRKVLQDVINIHLTPEQESEIIKKALARFKEEVYGKSN